MADVLTIVERHIDEAVGHHHTVIGAIDQLAGGRPKRIITMRSDNPALVENPNVHCVLSTGRDYRKHPSQAFENDLAALETVIGVPSVPVSILFPTVQHNDIGLCVRFLDRHPGTARFALRILIFQTIDALTDAERADLDRHVQSGAITIVTETGSLAKLLNARFGLKALNTLLLPCSINPESPPQEAAVPRKTNHFRIGYLGGYRLEKGAEKIPAILQDLKVLLRDCDPAVTVEFVAQHRGGRSGRKRLRYEWEMRKSGWSLSRANRRINITLLDKTLPPEQFIAALHAVDLLLVPYDLNAYAARGSGIIIDGVLAGKPIVHTQGIRMSSFLGFGNAAAAVTTSDFAPKIMEVLHNFQDYQAQTPKARDAAHKQIWNAADFLRNF